MWLCPSEEPQGGQVCLPTLWAYK
nr:hypothetical protein [Candidatus Methylacidiphilum fumarolicum]